MLLIKMVQVRNKVTVLAFCMQCLVFVVISVFTLSLITINIYPKLENEARIKLTGTTLYCIAVIII